MNTKINENPIRYDLVKTTEKKKLFSKTVITVHAVGDENGEPITPFIYDSIQPYEDGFACALGRRRTGTKLWSLVIDINGRQMLQSYCDAGCDIKWEHGCFTISDLIGNKGIAARNEKILIEPKKNNYLEIIGDIVLFGDTSGPTDYWSMGIGKLVGNELVTVVPRGCNNVQYIDGRVVGAGRTVSAKSTTASSLTTNRVTTTSRIAFQLYSVDTGKISDLVFGEIHKTKSGSYSALVYPKIRSEELLHRQTMGEAFSGDGLLDFSGEKHVVLNERFEFPNAK